MAISQFQFQILKLALVVLFLSSCQRTYLDQLDLGKRIQSEGVITEFNKSPTQVPLSLTNCVHVYYDKTKPEGFDSLGTYYATNLLNLLGHFAEYQRHVSAVEDYVAGDIHKCGVNIFIDTNYFTVLPDSFVADFKSTNTRVAWVGANSWKLGFDYLASTFGVSYNATEPYTKLDNTHLDADGKPTFFKNVYYKGEKFYKYGDWGKRDPYLTTFFAPFEISKWDYNLAQVLNTTDHNILAEIEHNYTLEKIPWAIQSQNKYIFSEVPFSFMHEADRYFIFADLLFDILQAAPRHNGKPAIVRFEDVHSEVTLLGLQRGRQIFNQNGVKAHVSIIPIYSNPLNVNDVYVGLPERPMTANAAFMNEINLWKSQGHHFIWHGITHQLDNKLNPWESNSGSDYEFWDFSYDVETNQPWPLVGRPVPNENAFTIIERFKKGANVLKDVGIIPKVWLTPHYHGSSLSNYVFGQMFEWNIGRVVYYTNNMTGLDVEEHHDEMKFPNISDADWRSRFDHLRNLRVDQELRQNGQLFPYEIYGDVYGQRLFPENIGNVNRELSEQILNIRTTPQILEDAKRNLVLRDVWASAFYHPYILDGEYWLPGSTLTNNDLNSMLVGIKNLGYNFVSLDDKSAEWKNVRAKKINYR